MPEYKFRAECELDVKAFESLAGIGVDMKGCGAPIPDRTGTFIDDRPLSELGAVAESLEDGHVIAETLAHIADYTGERAPPPVSISWFLRLRDILFLNVGSAPR